MAFLRGVSVCEYNCLLKEKENSLTINILKVTIIKTLIRYLLFPLRLERQEIINARSDVNTPSIDTAPGAKQGRVAKIARVIEIEPIIAIDYFLNSGNIII